MRFGSVQLGWVGLRSAEFGLVKFIIYCYKCNDSSCKNERWRRMTSLFWSFIRSRSPNFQPSSSQILFIWLPWSRECFFFFVYVPLSSSSYNYEQKKNPMWFNSDIANLIFFLLIGFCERSPWKIWCAFLTYIWYSWDTIAFSVRFDDAHDRSLSTFGFRNNRFLLFCVSFLSFFLFSFLFVYLWLPCLVHGNWPIRMEIASNNLTKKKAIE